MVVGLVPVVETEHVGMSGVAEELHGVQDTFALVLLEGGDGEVLDGLLLAALVDDAGTSSADFFVDGEVVHLLSFLCSCFFVVVVVFPSFAASSFSRFGVMSNRVTLPRNQS